MVEILSLLKEALGNDKVLSGAAVEERYYHIWKMDIPLNAKAVVLPRSTEDVAQTLKICHAHNQAVVVHGGLTNLVGSTETRGDEVVIAMERLNQIEEVDEKGRTITVQAGVILENIQNAAQEKDLLFPLNFGAKGSAQIGGVISTNAGGLRVFRFGMTRNLVLGLEAVLADGTIISSLKKIIKDNSAYDLKQLFVGSEGTLGIITKAVLKLVEAPRSRNSAFVGINAYEQVVDFLKYMDKGLAGMLSGFELIWKPTFEVLTGPHSSVKPPLPYHYKYYVLIESLGSHQERDQQMMQDLIEQALVEGKIEDAVLAQSQSDLNWFWTIREDVHVMVSQCNNDQHFDISMPTPKIGTYVEEVLVQLYRVAAVEKVFAFGHIADGNVHFVVGKENDSQALINKVNAIIYGPLKALKGSVSAEHGIGLHKKAYLELCRTEEEITMMKTLKKALDPKGILNPEKVLDL